jgi:MFS family permease
LPFYLTQFSGAFNDNLYKNALLLLITFTTVGWAGLPVDLVVNLAAFLFIVPYFLFSGLAGQLADRHEKSRIIRWVKTAEIAIMTLAAIALWQGWYGVLLGLLFLMGTQSAFFGPVKYSILPQVLEPSELVGGNGLVSGGTFVAILLGTIAAGVLASLPLAIPLIAIAVVIMALSGYLSARQIPATGAPELPESMSPMRWQPLRESWRLMAVAAEQRPVLLAILAISWFWFLGAAYLTQFPNFARLHLQGDETVVTLLLSLFIVGIASGSVLCERLTRHSVSLVPVPWGALGLTLPGIDLFFALPASAVPTTWWLLLRVLVDLLLIGVAGGLFIVPLYAYIQSATEAHKRARIIAALNVINSLFMLVSALAGMLLLGIAGLSIPLFLLILSVVNLLVLPLVLQIRRYTGTETAIKHVDK